MKWVLLFLYDKKNLILVLAFCGNLIIAKADNSVRIIPDSTNKFIQIEISRNHPSIYQVILMDEKETILYKKQESIDAEPTIISINWENVKPGFYYVLIKNKKEKVKLLFVKKEMIPQ